eukprot:1413411-Prymnesium_polylepis.1
MPGGRSARAESGRGCGVVRRGDLRAAQYAQAPTPTRAPAACAPACGDMPCRAGPSHDARERADASYAMWSLHAGGAWACGTARRTRRSHVQYWGPQCAGRLPGAVRSCAPLPGTLCEPSMCTTTLTPGGLRASSN